jgi:hypothetical protein
MKTASWPPITGLPFRSGIVVLALAAFPAIAGAQMPDPRAMSGMSMPSP